MDLYIYLAVAIFLPPLLAHTVAVSKKKTRFFKMVNIVVFHFSCDR